METIRICFSALLRMINISSLSNQYLNAICSGVFIYLYIFTCNIYFKVPYLQQAVYRNNFVKFNVNSLIIYDRFIMVYHHISVSFPSQTVILNEAYVYHVVYAYWVGVRSLFHQRLRSIRTKPTRFMNSYFVQSVRVLNRST